MTGFRRPAFSVPRRKAAVGEVVLAEAATSNAPDANMLPLSAAKIAREHANVQKFAKKTNVANDQDTLTAFKVLYTARSYKKRNNKSWSGGFPQ
jgi:hypothetical protein